MFSWDSDLVKEARREFFLKHSSHFTTEGTCNLSEIFKQMAMSADLLGTSIHEIQVSWTGPDELKQANYALRLYQIIFSVTEYFILKLDKLLLTAVSFLKSEENVIPANFVTP